MLPMKKSDRELCLPTSSPYLCNQIISKYDNVHLTLVPDKCPNQLFLKPYKIAKDSQEKLFALFPEKKEEKQEVVLCFFFFN